MASEKPLDLFRRLVEPLGVAPGSPVRLPRGFDPGHTAGFVDEASAATTLAAGVALISDFQARLWARAREGLLVIVQGLDASGKDGTVRHVLSGVNPAGVRVTSFKAPNSTELKHDFLWRHQRHAPERGGIEVFNRSHYEEVLAVRVHAELLERESLPPRALRDGIWKRRFHAINEWERHLVESGFSVVKLFLNVSREEQGRRLLARIDDPSRNWKFAMGDVVERRAWSDYMRAYSEVLTYTSTEWAPWYVIPADHKWFARLAGAAVVVDALRRIDPHYPVLPPDQRTQLEQAHQELLGG